MPVQKGSDGHEGLSEGGNSPVWLAHTEGLVTVEDQSEVGGCEWMRFQTGGSKTTESSKLTDARNGG
jgi:hypothetical protein